MATNAARRPSLPCPPPWRRAHRGVLRTRRREWDLRVGGGLDRRGPRTRSVPRALLCAVASAIVPGLGQVFQRRWRAAVLFGLPTVALALFGMWVIGTRPGHPGGLDGGPSDPTWALHRRPCLGPVLLRGRRRRRTRVVAGSVQQARRSRRWDPPGGLRGAGRAPPGHGRRPRDRPPGHAPRHRLRRLRRRPGGPAEPARRPRHHDDGRPAHDRRGVRRSDHRGDHGPADGADHTTTRSRPLEHRAAGGRRRTASLGVADRHDDRGQRRPPDR